MNILTVEIPENSVEKRVSRKSGTEYSVQHFYLTDTDTGRMKSYEMFVRDQPFDPGKYHLDLAKSLRGAGSDQLEIGNLHLIPIETKKPAAKSA